MADRGIIPAFDWFSNQHTLGARADFAQKLAQLLEPLLHQDIEVLDLCCGGGAVAFVLEEHGAHVTAIDQAPGLLAMARAEAKRRKSRVAFVQGDVLEGGLGHERYELVACVGNAVLDFPPGLLPGFLKAVWESLKPGGHFALEYHDGILRLLAMREPACVVEAAAVGSVERRFQGYDPVQGAYVAEYHNVGTDEVFQYIGYLYTGPVIRCLARPWFDLEQSARFEKWSFVDVFRKKDGGAGGTEVGAA
jgi:SAM-dependent methyltransferase